MLNQHKSEFVRTFKNIARSKHRYEVFKDFVTMAAISLNNSMAMSDDLESEYLHIINSYQKDDQSKMSELLSHVVMGLEESHCDFLGDVFMSLELGSGDKGQFFTPYSVSKMMAEVSFNSVENDLKTKPFITVSEPACGAGGMIIALSEVMLERGYNPQERMFVQCVDIDPVACMMSYVQLALLGIPAEVITGNTLSMQYTDSIKTPFFYLGLWESKLRRYWTKGNGSETIINDNHCEVSEAVITDNDNSPVFLSVCRESDQEEGRFSKTVLKVEEQMVLF